MFQLRHDDMLPLPYGRQPDHNEMAAREAAPIVKHSVFIKGHKTSVSLERIFFIELRRIARAQKTSLQDYITGIDGRRKVNNLSSALRQHVIAYILAERDAAREAAEGQRK